MSASHGDNEIEIQSLDNELKLIGDRVEGAGYSQASSGESWAVPIKGAQGRPHRCCSEMEDQS